jgi:hypothetical protein
VEAKETIKDEVRVKEKIKDEREQKNNEGWKNYEKVW